jgi:hypothetical protein
MPPSEYTVTTQSSAPSGLATLTTKIPGRNALDLLGKVRAVASAVLCAMCSFIFVVMIHPDSSTDWDAPTIIVWIITLFAPLALVIWSFIAWPSLRSRALWWTRRLIACHLIFAVAAPILTLLLDFAYVFQMLGAAFGGVLLDILVLILGPPASSAPNVLRLYASSLLALSAAALGALFAWSFATIGLVAWQAETTAGEQRYCMTVPIDSEAHYRPVASLFDLRGLKLRAPVTPSVAGAPGSRRSNHLLLHAANGADPKHTEGGEDRVTFWHWSHRQRRFLPPELWTLSPDPWGDIGIRPTRNSCVAEAHFVRHLPIFSPR